MKWLVSLLLTAFASVAPCAGAQSLTVTTSNDPVGDAIETTEDALGDATQPGSMGDSAGGLGDTGGDAADSGTAPAHASPGKAFRTRFDRLPSRLERLLERIELGRDVRANLRRLEQALASASAGERARLLRLLDAEIRRLRTDGVSPTERRRIKRLARTRAALTAQSAPTTVAGADAPAGSSGRTLGAVPGAPAGGEVLGAPVARNAAPPSNGVPPKGGAVEPSGPAETSAFPLIEVLLALGAVLLVIVAGFAVKEERSA